MPGAVSMACIRRSWRSGARRPRRRWPSRKRPVPVSNRRSSIKELERELRRKDKALAEAAALLVLSKKLGAIFNTDKGEDA